MKNRKLYVATLLILLVMLLNGCSKSAKNEMQIVKDLQDYPSFLAGQDAEITDYDIIKRQTDKKSKYDIVYIHIAAENDLFLWNQSYKLTYGLYNEGWILDEVSEYNRSDWVVRPLQGVSDNTILRYVNSLKEECGFDSVEVVDRKTSLDDNFGTDEIAFEAKKEQLFSTEVKKLTQTWSFNVDFCEFGLYGDPVLTDRTVFLNEEIIGMEFNNIVRNSRNQDIFQDTFDIRIDTVIDNGLLLTVTMRDNWAAWWNGLDKPPETTTQLFCDTITYFEGEEKIGLSLAGLHSQLYSSGDRDDFGEYDYLLLSLDKPNGFIQTMISNELDNAKVKEIGTISRYCGENLTWTLNYGILTISGTGPMDDYKDYYNEIIDSVVMLYAPWEYNRHKIEQVVIEDGVTSIGDEAFCSFDDYAITKIIIPNSVTTIGCNAFSSCDRLTSIKIPSSVTSIASNAFLGCSNLSTIYYSGTVEQWLDYYGGTLEGWIASVTSDDYPINIKVVCTDDCINGGVPDESVKEK